MCKFSRRDEQSGHLEKKKSTTVYRFYPCKYTNADGRILSSFFRFCCTSSFIMEKAYESFSDDESNFISNSIVNRRPKQNLRFAFCQLYLRWIKAVYELCWPFSNASTVPNFFGCRCTPRSTGINIEWHPLNKSVFETH